MKIHALVSFAKTPMSVEFSNWVPTEISVGVHRIRSE